MEVDEFGQFNGTQRSIDFLVKYLVDDGIITFSYSPDKVNCYVLTIAGPLDQLGEVIFGGNIVGLYLVSMRMRGANYFDLRPGNHLNSDYVSEKLNLSKYDGIQISELLNNIIDLKIKYLRVSRK